VRLAMHSTANAPYIGTVDGAPHGGIYRFVPRLPFKGSQIALNYVPAGIKVCIKPEATPLTYKMCLVSPILSGYVPAPATLLRGVACIYIDHFYPLCLCFILYQPLELGKVPAVYPSSVLFTGFYPLPYSLKLLKNYNPTSRNKLNYLLCHFMVDCSPKPFLPLRKLFKVSFGRGSAFGLQTFSKSLIPLRYSPYVSSIKELVYLSIRSRNYSKLAKPKVNSYEEVRGFHIRNILFYSYVQEELSKLFVVFEVCRGNLPVKVLLEVVRNLYLEPLSSLYGSKGNFLSIQPNSIGAFIVTDSRVVTLRTPALESFSLSLYSGLETFCSHNSCGYNELGREGRFISYSVVGRVVELNTVPDLGFPSYFASVVVGELELFKGFKEYLLLFLSGSKNKLKSSLQLNIRILPKYLQAFKSGLLPFRKGGVSDRKEGKDEFDREKSFNNRGIRQF